MGGGQLGHFHNIYLKYKLPKCIAFNWSFIFGVWPLYFDFHKINVI
jgi:hypothetical protein